jgi:hypothetical protein
VGVPVGVREAGVDVADVIKVGVNVGDSVDVTVYGTENVLGAHDTKNNINITAEIFLLKYFKVTS